MLKKLPLDVSSFEKIINQNYLYIDKTEYIYNLFNSSSNYYFLSRPRRFGKSLLISTLKELFSGNKELFKDLYIYKTDWEFKNYPIIYLDFSAIGHRTSDQLGKSINNKLIAIAEGNQLLLNKEDFFEENLEKLINYLSKINKVVVLIDEYDKPILDHIDNIEEAEKQRSVLKSFYDVLKSSDSYLRAIFLTGVTKFSKTSVFSGLNNLNNLTLKPEACSLLGYTEKELLENFDLYIERFSKEKNIDKDRLLKELKNYYNGYRFSKEDVKVYNPFSVLYALNDKEVINYWISSGNPEFLIKLLKKNYQSIENLETAEFSVEAFDTFDISNIDTITLLFQTGYLTIVDYNKENKAYKINFPNQEIKESFTKYLIRALSNYNISQVDNKIYELKRLIEENNLEKFFEIIQELFSHIPYTLLSKLEKEKDYHMLLQLIFSLVSIKSYSEIITNNARLDLFIETKNYIYIFEFKLNKSAEIALKQIKDKEYYRRLLSKNKKIVLVGLNFINEKDKIKFDFIREDLKNN